MMTLHPLGALSFQLDHRNLEASQGAERSPGSRHPTWFCFFSRKRSDPPPPGDRGGGPSFGSNGSAKRFSQSERPGRTSKKQVLRPAAWEHQLDHRNLEASQGADRSPGAQLGFAFFRESAPIRHPLGTEAAAPLLGVTA
jgi:hypothetical protein